MQGGLTTSGGKYTTGIRVEGEPTVAPPAPAAGVASAGPGVVEGSVGGHHPATSSWWNILTRCVMIPRRNAGAPRSTGGRGSRAVGSKRSSKRNCRELGHQVPGAEMIARRGGGVRRALWIGTVVAAVLAPLAAHAGVAATAPVPADPSGARRGGTSMQLRASVACGDSNCLTVWQDLRGADVGDAGDIWGAMLGPSSSPVLIPEIPIATGLATSRGPSVAWDGTRYVVVWEDDRTGMTEIRGAWVESDGSVSGPPGGVTLLAGGMTGIPGPHTLTRVACAATGCAVVFQAAAQSRVAVVAEDGAVTSVTTLPFAYASDIATDGAGYLALGVSGITSLVARVTTDGEVLDPAGVVLATSVAGLPSVAWQGSHYFAAWFVSTGGGTAEVRGTGVSPEGVVETPGGNLILDAGTTCTGPLHPVTAPRLAGGSPDGSMFLTWMNDDYEFYGPGHAVVWLDASGSVIPMKTMWSYFANPTTSTISDGTVDDPWSPETPAAAFLGAETVIVRKGVDDWPSPLTVSWMDPVPFAGEWYAQYLAVKPTSPLAPKSGAAGVWFGDSYLVAWTAPASPEQDEDVLHAIRVGTSGAPSDAAPFEVSRWDSSPWNGSLGAGSFRAHRVVAAATSQRAFVAWLVSDLSGADGAQIAARRYQVDMTPVDEYYLPILPSKTASELAGASDGDRFLVAWTSSDGAGPHDVRATVVDPTLLHSAWGSKDASRYGCCLGEKLTWGAFTFNMYDCANSCGWGHDFLD